MSSQKKLKRSFFLVEVLMAMSLVCIVLMPCVQFYSGVRKSFEENILSLQLPAVIDLCFFSVESQMREQMSSGQVPSSGSGLLPGIIYTSSGKEVSVPYQYQINVRKKVRSGSNIVKICLADVSLELFPEQKQAVLVQRCMCVTS